MAADQGSAAIRDTRATLRDWRDAVPGDRLAHLVRDTGRALLRALQVRLGEQGVAFGHWAFLRVLWERDGLTQRELSARAGVTEPTTLQAIKAMERLGYVVRRRLPDSKARVHVFLTPRGLALKSRLVPLAEQVNAIAMRGVPAEAVSATRSTLLTMIDNLARDAVESRPARIAAVHAGPGE
jgi:DNA-binding MarR family transcriptional regulator